MTGDKLDCQLEIGGSQLNSKLGASEEYIPSLEFDRRSKILDFLKSSQMIQTV